MTLTRRRMFSASASLALAGAAGALLAPPWRQAKADAGMPDPADLAKAGPDGDVVLGSDKAPVTIIEYASMTCPHCAHFSKTPFRSCRSATSIPARCASSSANSRSMRSPQRASCWHAAPARTNSCRWSRRCSPNSANGWWRNRSSRCATSPSNSASPSRVSTQCLANQKVLDGIQDVRDRAAEKLGVNSTPTFFINGKKFMGDQSIEALAKEIDPYLKDG